MKKGKFIFGFMIILEIFLILVIVNQEKSRSIYKKRDGIGLILKGKIIQVHSEGDFLLVCLKVEDSNYREYRKEADKFFIRVKDSLAVMAYSFSNKAFKKGTKLLINHNFNNQIIELEEGDTISKQPIEFYATGDYLKNSCVPD